MGTATIERASQKRKEWTLRAATEADIDAVASVWHQGWADGHLGHTPPALAAHRHYEDFRQRVPSRLTASTVAVDDSTNEVVGFVTIHGNEVEQVYVAAAARGTGIAAALLRHAESRIRREFDRAWLAVAVGNARARHFYEREGWFDGGAVDYPAEVADGTLVVPSRCYEKTLIPERAS